MQSLNTRENRLLQEAILLPTTLHEGSTEYAEIFMSEIYEVVEAATQEFLIRNFICLQKQIYL